MTIKPKPKISLRKIIELLTRYFFYDLSNILISSDEITYNSIPKRTMQININVLWSIHSATGPKVAYGCDLAIIQLTCDSGVINVTSAFYGQYFLTCAECCSPLHSYDCTESMYEHRLTDWVILTIFMTYFLSIYYNNSSVNTIF